MAEINYNNLYNQLTPEEQIEYGGYKIARAYDVDDANTMAEGTNFKEIFDAQQQIPEKGFFSKVIDTLNPFSEVSAAEPPQIPDLTYRNVNLPFDLKSGVTNTTQAAPFLKSMSDIYSSGNTNSDLINRLIAENQMKTNQSNFPNSSPFLFPESDTNRTIPLDMNKFKGASDMSIIDETTNDEQNSEYINDINKNNENGLMSFFRSLPTPTNLLLNMMPKEDPGATNIRNFYRNRYGLTSNNSLASGIMKGYNSVYGSNFLNKISGGKLPARSFGLADAARRRIEKIAKRKRAQTDASRAKIKQLQDFARADTIERGRFKNPEVYKNAEKLGLIDKKTGGFKSTGTNENFSNKTGRGRTGY